MKKHIWILAVLLLLSALLFASCGEKTVQIEFRVGNHSYAYDVPKGQIPQFDGSTDREGEGEYIFKFTGWDKEIVPAAENTTYTAQYEQIKVKTYEVYWIFNNKDETTIVRENEIPVPPEGDEVIINEKQILTFTGWDQELEPLTPEYLEKLRNRLVFRAKYSREDRIYTVRFVSDGKEYGSVQAKYGDVVTYEGEMPQKEGFAGCIWGGIEEPVTGDMDCEAIFTVNDPAQVEAATKVALLSFDKYKPENNADVSNEANALLILLTEVRADPEGKWTKYLADRAAAHLKKMVGPDGEGPMFSLEPYWCYCNLTAAIAVAKETPAVWDQLTEEEQAKYDFVMEAFAYILTFGTADVNAYTTGPGLRGNFNKNWNPNYRLAVVTPMLFIGRYFGGADKVNEILANFSYDETVAKFKEYKFTRAYTEWTAEVPTLKNGKLAPTQKEVMENGGVIYLANRNDSTGDRLGIVAGAAAGSGKGVRVKYTYQNFTVDNVAGIFETLLKHNYGGGDVVSEFGKNKDGTYKAYILDGTKSPVEGERGMMAEFAGGDGNGIRSSVSYTSHDFNMIIGALIAFDELDMYHLEDNPKLFRMVWVGNTDFLYKYEHGYMNFSLGKGSEGRESAYAGFYFLKSWWLDRYGDLTLADFD